MSAMDGKLTLALRNSTLLVSGAADIRRFGRKLLNQLSNKGPFFQLNKMLTGSSGLESPELAHGLFGGTMRNLSKLLLGVTATVLLPSVPAHAATTVGGIFACYACQSTGDSSVDAALAANPSVAFDGLLLEFVNTSGSPITGGTFTVSTGSYTDSITLPTLAANSSFIFMPGISNDGGVHPSGSLFASTGITMDTSDGDGSVSDGSAFSFLGTSGTLSVTSGIFHAGDASLIRPFRDNPQNGSTSFLGLGPSGDGGCSNCYFGQIALLTVPSLIGAVPEPSTWAMMLVGFCGIGASMRRRRSATSALLA